MAAHVGERSLSAAACWRMPLSNLPRRLISKRAWPYLNKGYIDSAKFSLNMLALYVCIPPSVGAKRGSLVVAKVFKLLNEVRKDEAGVTMAEYAILLGLIAVVSIGIITTVGTDIPTYSQTSATQLGNVT